MRRCMLARLALPQFSFILQAGQRRKVRFFGPYGVARLPPCGKSTRVIGGGMVFFAAPDIILDVEAEKRNPERAAQIYANNASRVMAIRPGGKSEVNQTHVAWTQTKGVPGVPSPLYYNGRLY